MTNRAAGEIHKAGGILQQTYGETVASAYGLVFYQKADGKLYRAKGGRGRPRYRGVLYICVDAAAVINTVGNALAQGRVEKTGLVVDDRRAGLRLPDHGRRLTQTVPSGT